MDNKGFQQEVPPEMDADAPPPPAGYQAEQGENDDAPPPYPQNPMSFQGYNIGFCAPQGQDNNIPLQRDPNTPEPKFQDVPFLSEEEAREALAKFVSEHCCYGSSPVKKLTFTDCQSSSTYQYVLESFTETRMTEYVCTPYAGQTIFQNGMPPPGPWDIIVQPISLFRDEACTKCMGFGRRVCYCCSGRGRRRCTSCNGRGHRHTNNGNQRCTWCHGRGWSRCHSCSGTGIRICNCCKGSGRLKWYLQLKVEFKNNRDDYFKKTEEIPDELLRACVTKNIFSDQNLRVYPITNHPEQDINNASFNLLNTHASRFINSRILMQKHHINSIPVTLCKYKFNDKDYIFRVYGLDNKVYAPEYPRKCLCCSIL